MIIYDNIIKQIQPYGGVAILFNEIWSYLRTQGYPHLVVDASENGYKLRLLERYRKFQIPANLKHNKNIFHSTYYRLCDAKSMKTVTTVHDFTYERMLRGPRRRIHSTQKNRAIRASDVIVCVSNNTKADLLEFLPDIGEERIRVIHNGVSPRFKPLRNTDQSSFTDEILFVGQRTGYKNFETLIRALYYIPDVSLTCVGGGGLSRNEIQLLERLLPGRYRHLGQVSVDTLNDAYNKALCLVYPSLYEGFGIPILEAMRAGCPVVALHNSSIPEVAGDAALLLREICYEELRAALDRVGEKTEREKIRQAGFAQSSKFSWELTARQMLELYRELH